MKRTFIRKRKCINKLTWFPNRFFTNEDLKDVPLHTPRKFFKIMKKNLGKFLLTQKVILQWSCAFSMINYKYQGKFSCKKNYLFTLGLYTIILETENGRVEKLAKKSSELKGINKNWEIFKTSNAYEMKVHLVLFKRIYHLTFSVKHVKSI